MLKTIPIALILFLATGTPLCAQYSSRMAAPHSSLVFLSSPSQPDDTLRILSATDSLSAPYSQTKSTLLAMGLSAVLPGAGQVYNESYWKTPIILGLGGWFVYEWLQLNNYYRDYRDRYNASITKASPTGINVLKSYREYYRDLRDGFAWYLGILYALNILDAYVDASLYDFKQGLGVMLNASSQPNGIAINFKISF